MTFIHILKEMQTQTTHNDKICTDNTFTHDRCRTFKAQ